MDNSQFLQWDIMLDRIMNSAEGDKESAISGLIEQIVEYIYTNESDADGCMEYIAEKLDNPEIWQRIKSEVQSKTDFFIKTIELKRFSEDTAIEKIKSAYEYRYRQFENDDYICAEIALDKKQMRAIRCVFSYCEFSIILQHTSKRRFRVFLVEKGRFSEYFTDEIWDLFSDNRKDIEKLVYSRHLADLEMKVNYLMNGQDELKEELEFIEYLVIENSDMLADDLKD